MKYVKFLVALLAACMLVMPAFSMPNFGDNAKDGKALIDAPCQSPAAPEDPHGPQPCDCKDKKAPKSMMGPEGDKFAPKSMMDENAPCSHAPKSMMGGKCDKPMMGPEGDKFASKSMMDENAPCEQAPKMDAKEETPMMDEKAPMMDENAPCGHAPKSMMGGKCDKPMMGPEGDKFASKSMMDENAPMMDENAPCGHAPKSMMDGKFAPQDGPKGGKCATKSMMPEKAPCQKPFDGQDDKAPMQDCPCQGK